ncbi:MAG: PadR family transcriptional regulator [Gemmatimonas sp.]|nr:PadR family transcriptional regulator [Gemmatimonas sp.]
MTRTLDDPKALVPLSEAVFQILLSLADEDRHGYGIIQEVGERTDGRLRLGPGTLYGAIKRLRGQGLIEEVEADWRAADDERRRYYHLTALGRELATLEARRLERLLMGARQKKLLPQRGMA